MRVQAGSLALAGCFRVLPYPHQLSPNVHRDWLPSRLPA